MVREYLRTPAGPAARFQHGAGRAGRLGLRRRRSCPHRQVLHPAGFGRAGPFRGLVQPGAGAPEIRPLAAGRRSLRGSAETAAAILRSYTNLGIVREQLGDLAGARAAYYRAMAANPEGLAPIWNLALLFEHAGQADEAERYYKQMLDKAPKEEEARFRLGFLRLQRQDYRGAAEAFEGCLKYRPAWPEAHANLALAL